MNSSSTKPVIGPAEHLRRACEELGTLFIKLGQALSTRSDLLPDAYRGELAKLQDEVVPVPAAVIADVIREDLGAPPDKLFESFDPKPLGSASIGQVHAARLLDHREVVIKVRKPHVDELVKVDLEILGASSMNGLRVSRYSSDTTRVVCLENSATCCWPKSTMIAKQPI
jgi:ubiquinone biosynthesis protein